MICLNSRTSQTQNVHDSCTSYPNISAGLAKLFTFFVLLPPRLLWSLDRLNVTQSFCRVTKDPASRAGLEPESCLPRPFLVRLGFKQKRRIQGNPKSWSPWNLDLLGTLKVRAQLGVHRVLPEVWGLLNKSSKESFLHQPLARTTHEGWLILRVFGGFDWVYVYHDIPWYTMIYHDIPWWYTDIHYPCPCVVDVHTAPLHFSNDHHPGKSKGLRFGRCSMKTWRLHPRRTWISGAFLRFQIRTPTVLHLILHLHLAGNMQLWIQKRHAMVHQAWVAFPNQDHLHLGASQ